MQVGLSENKETRYKNRIVSSFNAYNNMCVGNEKKARKLLVLRLKYLTGNTRLVKNKARALVGIYFSNRHLEDKSSLLELEICLLMQIISIPNTIVRDSLLRRRSKKQISFLHGFEQRRFHKFSSADLQKIVMVWDNE